MKHKIPFNNTCIAKAFCNKRLDTLVGSCFNDNFNLHHAYRCLQNDSEKVINAIKSRCMSPRPGLYNHLAMSNKPEKDFGLSRKRRHIYKTKLDLV